jgi:dipeptidyl aminopeptidase/acylaminoacyl peptidase
MLARLGCCLFAAAALLAQQPVSTTFDEFFAADSPAEAARRADPIIKSGVSFDEALRRLKAGRAYQPQRTGVVHLSNRTEDGTEHNYAVNIPEGYDPSRRYQVRFQLHGGIGGRSDNKPRGTGEIGPLAGAEQIYVLPYAWNEAPWWGNDQILNLDAIIDSLKRTYNIDENRVVLSGVSDGATGAYFIAMRDTTPFASFLPLNGFLMVLANNEVEDGRIFPNNLRNKPLFVINGGKDRLYPISIVEPFTNHLAANGVDIEYHPQPEGEHNTRWWPR